MSMKNSNDAIGNRTRDLPVCSAVPQSTAPPRSTMDYHELFPKSMFLGPHKFVIFYYDSHNHHRQKSPVIFIKITVQGW